MVKDATDALLKLSSPCFVASLTDDNSVKFKVFTVKARNGELILPVKYVLEVDLDIRFNEERKTYSLSGTYYDVEGFSSNYDTYRGEFVMEEWGKYITVDGVKCKKLTTRPFFSAISSSLSQLGWKPARM